MKKNSKKAIRTAKNRARRKNALQRVEPACFVLELPQRAKARFRAVVVYARVSSRGQSLVAQVKRLERECAKRGFKVVAVILDTSSVTENPYGEKFKEAVETAKAHGAAIVAESLDRFTRSREWTKENQDAYPTAQDIQLLEDAAEGVTLYTLLNPDTYSWREVRGAQTRRSGKAGRPKKVSRQIEQGIRDAKVQWLSRLGAGTDTVARIVGLSPQAVAKRKRILNPNLPKLKSGQRGAKIVIK